MELDNFNKLNLQNGQQVKVTYVSTVNNKIKSKVVVIREIKEIVLGPVQILGNDWRLLCIVNIDGGFIRVNKIIEIELMDEWKTKTFKIHWKDGSEPHTVKGDTIKKALNNFGYDLDVMDDVSKWEEVQL